MISAKFKAILPEIYDGMPVSLRKIISPVIEPANFLIKRILAIIAQIRLPVYIFQGRNKWNYEALNIIQIGEGRGILPYFHDLLYAEEPQRKVLEKIFIWNVKSQISSYSSGSDLVLISLDMIFLKFLSKQCFIVLPEWVMFKLNLIKPLKTGRKNKRLSSNLNKIKKFEYSYEITHDVAKFEYFYHNMYLAYSRKRYGKLSLVAGFHHLRRIFEKGALLLVNQGCDKYVSGFLIETGVRNFSARYSGVKEGEIKYIEKGALAACYYFTISYAKEKGYKWIDFGHCRPFFHDGAFSHKKTWGMEIKKSKRRMLATKSVIGLKILNHGKELTSFLSQNPFIFINEGTLKGLIFTQSEEPVTFDEVKLIYDSYCIDGIDSIIVVSYHGFTHDAVEFASSLSQQRLVLTDLKPEWIS